MKGNGKRDAVQLEDWTGSRPCPEKGMVRFARKRSGQNDCEGTERDVYGQQECSLKNALEWKESWQQHGERQ